MTSQRQTTPVGRFAPSPTGPLHMGSLVTALASYLNIKSQAGRWLVRIDNIDPPREEAGSVEKILHALDLHGLHPDEPVHFQADHTERYSSALTELAHATYFCTCTRKSLKGKIYPGTCRGHTSPRPESAVRLRLDLAVNFEDTRYGSKTYVPGIDFGDPIIRRKDGLWAYAFATAIDDSQGYTEVVRGEDLLETTPVQLAIMDLLGLPAPVYTHLPLLKYPDGNKLSKQTHAPALDLTSPVENIRAALRFLNHPPGTGAETVTGLLTDACAAWDLDRVPKTLQPFTPNT